MCSVFLVNTVYHKLPNRIYFINFEFAWISDYFLEFELIFLKMKRIKLRIRRIGQIRSQPSAPGALQPTALGRDDVEWGLAGMRWLGRSPDARDVMLGGVGRLALALVIGSGATLTWHRPTRKLGQCELGRHPTAVAFWTDPVGTMAFRRGKTTTVQHRPARPIRCQQRPTMSLTGGTHRVAIFWISTNPKISSLHEKNR
jgi:hypothetical protein